MCKITVANTVEFAQGTAITSSNILKFRIFRSGRASWSEKGAPIRPPLFASILRRSSLHEYFVHLTDDAESTTTKDVPKNNSLHINLANF